MALASNQPGARRAGQQPGAMRGAPPTGGIDKLEQERKLALERLDSLRTYYDRPDAAQLLAQFQGRAGGKDAPFTPDVIGGLLGANADASAGQAGSERDMIRQQFSNAGLGGSGMETSAMITSRRRAQQAARSGRREITSRAALENFQARERAQQQIATYLRDRQQAEQTAGLAEVDFRSQMRDVQSEGGQNRGGIANGPHNNFGRPGGGFGVDPTGNGFDSYGSPIGAGGGGFAERLAEAADPFVPTWQEYQSPGPRQTSAAPVGPVAPTAQFSSGSRSTDPRRTGIARTGTTFAGTGRLGARTSGGTAVPLANRIQPGSGRLG